MEEEAQENFARDGGEALNLDDDFNDSEEGSMGAAEAEQKAAAISSKVAPPPKVDGQKLDNQPYDLAVDVNDSEEIESDEEDDEVTAMQNERNPGSEAQ
jgi:hypothetical protein